MKYQYKVVGSASCMKLLDGTLSFGQHHLSFPFVFRSFVDLGM